VQDEFLRGHELMFKELLLKRIDALEAKMAASKQDRIDLQNLRNQLVKLSVHDFAESSEVGSSSSTPSNK
jgi:uncharacterized protein YaaW (UPF0174 family)